jgi:hypothetical protein
MEDNKRMTTGQDASEANGKVLVSWLRLEDPVLCHGATRRALRTSPYETPIEFRARGRCRRKRPATFT